MIELVELSSSEVPGLWLRELSSPPVGQLTCFTMGGRYGMNGPGFPALKRCPCAGLGRGRRLLGDLGSERTPSRTMRIPGGLRAGVRGGQVSGPAPRNFSARYLESGPALGLEARVPRGQKRLRSALFGPRSDWRFPPPGVSGSRGHLSAWGISKIQLIGGSSFDLAMDAPAVPMRSHRD